MFVVNLYYSVGIIDVVTFNYYYLSQGGREVVTSRHIPTATTKKPMLSHRLFLWLWGAVVEEVRTVFEKNNDVTMYIPELQPETFV